MSSTQVDDVDSEIDEELTAQAQPLVLSQRCPDCGGPLVEAPSFTDHTGSVEAEIVCQSCGLVHGSTVSSDKPFNRKPTSSIIFDESRYGTSHTQTFEALKKSNFFESLNGKKDAGKYYALRHLYAGSRDYRERILNEGLQRLSGLFAASGFSSNHRLANLCGKEFRKQFNKLLPKSVSLQLQFAQQFINKNRPDTKVIDRTIASSIKSVDETLLEKMRIRMKLESTVSFIVPKRNMKHHR